MDVFEAMWTTRSMRHLDPSRPIPVADLWTIIEAASKGPGRGATSKFVVVTDEERRKQIGDRYREGWAIVGTRIRSTGFIPRSGDWLGEHFGESPAIIVAVGGPRAQASIYNQLQNLFLAALALGIGTTLTVTDTRPPDYEQKMKAILAIPDDQRIWAVIPLGYPTGRWGEAKRAPVEEWAFWDGWGEKRTRSQ